MGVTKAENFDPAQNEIAAYAKALGHPARIAIVQHLVKTNQCICNDLVDLLPLSQATISQHLKELKNVGIIKGDIEGTSVCYCIDAKKWKMINSTFGKLFNALKKSA